MIMEVGWVTCAWRPSHGLPGADHPDARARGFSASYAPSIRRRSSPFVMPVQPRPATVSTLWPWSAEARSSGSCSSRRTRTSQQRCAREVERRDRLVASHGRELAKKLVQRLATFEVVEQRLYLNACADEHRRTPKNVRVAVHDVA